MATHVEDGPTAIRVCALARRRLPGSHAMPGIRGGETVWREDEDDEMRPAWMAGVRLQILSAAVNQRNIAFPCDVLQPTHGSSKPLNGSQAAQRLSHSARRSVEDGPTAIRVCALARRRLPGSHAMPGIRGGETVWREDEDDEMRPAWMAGVRLQILSAAVNQRNIAFPVAYQPVRHPTR